MENFKRNLYFVFGKIYIPEKLKNYNGKILIHISDTPEIFYHNLKCLLNTLKPAYVIHTGDLVDNVKLEIYPIRIQDYYRGVSKLIDILENSTAKEIFIALGNHDDIDVVREISNKSTIISKSQILYIENRKIYVSHFPNEIMRQPSDINLFGHDLTLNSKVEDGKIYLNGISSINIIALENMEVFTLMYPLGINSERLCRRKIGI